MANYDNPPGVLLGAVVAKWLATPGLSGIEGPHLNRRPVDKASDDLPYCVMRLLESFDDGWTSVSRRWLCVIEFEFFAATPEAANGHVNTFNGVFSQETLALTFSVGGLISHRQVGADITEAEQPDMQRNTAKYKFRFWLPRVG